MLDAQRQIEERKRALTQPNAQYTRKDLDSVRPFLKDQTTLATMGAMYSQGLLSKTDTDKAKKIAELQAQIQSRFKSGLLNNVQNHDKPKPLILDESGRTVDSSGKEVQLTLVEPTLKANIRAKKREEFKAQMLDSKVPKEMADTHFFDNRISK